jgi:hypothetical protein
MCRLPPSSFWYWASVLVVLAARIAWCGQYLVLTTLNPLDSKLRGWKRVRAAFRQTTAQLSFRRSRKRPSSDVALQRHTAFIEESQRLETTILVLGSLALAAWTQLYAAAGTPTSAANGLEAITRELLFVGVVALLGGAVLFRFEGSHVTTMGRETTRAVGFTAVVASLASAIPVALDAPEWIGIALALSVAVRDCAEVAMLGLNDWRLLSKGKPEAPPAATESGPSPSDPAAEVSPDPPTMGSAPQPLSQTDAGDQDGLDCSCASNLFWL